MNPMTRIIAAGCALAIGCGVLVGCDDGPRRPSPSPEQTTRAQIEAAAMQSQMPPGCTVTVIMRDGYSWPYFAMVRCPEGVAVIKF